MDLLDSINKNLHYIGEILVVVFGVLIAFFMSNVSDERKRRKRIKQILEIVKLNFKQDIKIIKIELEKLDSKEKNIINIVDTSIDNKSLSYEIKFSALNFLFNHPSIVLQKEGYYLLKDADFNYDTKRNKIVSEIITMYSYHFENIERQRDKVIRTSEHNSINHMQDPWQHYNIDTVDGKKKIDDYLDKNINSEHFINELDYMARCAFGVYRMALEDYLKEVNLILERLKQ